MEIAFDLDPQRIARLYEIFEDHIDNVLVKNLKVAKGNDIQL
jgi:hypothetical protein